MVSSLGLTHPLAAAQAGGFIPRRWLPGFCGRAAPAADLPLVFGCLSVGLDARGLPACTRVLGPEQERTQFCRGECADVGHARACRHGFACVPAACGVHVRPSASGSRKARLAEGPGHQSSGQGR